MTSRPQRASLSYPVSDRTRRLLEKHAAASAAAGGRGEGAIAIGAA